MCISVQSTHSACQKQCKFTIIIIFFPYWWLSYNKLLSLSCWSIPFPLFPSPLSPAFSIFSSSLPVCDHSQGVYFPPSTGGREKFFWFYSNKQTNKQTNKSSVSCPCVSSCSFPPPRIPACASCVTSLSSSSPLPPPPSPCLFSSFCYCWGAHLRSRSFHYHNHLFPLLVVVLYQNFLSHTFVKSHSVLCHVLS